MTIQEFNMLPLLLKRKVVLMLTGWSRKTLDALVAAGTIKPAVVSPGQGHRYFRREELRGYLLKT
jgi:DNA-binding transcriptional MerR regulator